MLMGTGFLFEVVNMFWDWTVVTVVQTLCMY